MYILLYVKNTIKLHFKGLCKQLCTYYGLKSLPIVILLDYSLLRTLSLKTIATNDQDRHHAKRRAE
ncbi:MAG: hypothetical protein K0S90_2056 [Enterobacteriaceae bacterium]|jgi:hypothetical protein|nr:hypothetical protein [Enterobacteriaceae bacterium]